MKGCDITYLVYYLQPWHLMVARLANTKQTTSYIKSYTVAWQENSGGHKTFYISYPVWSPSNHQADRIEENGGE
jgi:hypothetical protein